MKRHIAYTRADDDGMQLKQIVTNFPDAQSNAYSDPGESFDRPMIEREDGHAMLEALFKDDVIVVTDFAVAFNSLYDLVETTRTIYGCKAELIVLSLGVEPLTQGDVDFMTRIAQFGMNARSRYRTGYKGGTPPFGYKVGDGGRLERQPWLDDVINVARPMVGSWSLREIQSVVKDKCGRDVSLPTLSKLLKMAAPQGASDLGL